MDRVSVGTASSASFLGTGKNALMCSLLDLRERHGLSKFLPSSHSLKIPLTRPARLLHAPRESRLRLFGRPLDRALSPALSSAPNKWTTKYSRFQITANYWYELKPNENTWQASFITAFNVWSEVASSSRLMLSVHHERNGLLVVSVCFLVSHSCADSRI